MEGIDVAVADAGSLDSGQVLSLYRAVGWSSYTDQPQILMESLRGSTLVAVAHFEGVLVGLVRVISDGSSICYIQDVLVDPLHQRRGVGRELVSLVLEKFSGVRQKVLLTDDEPGQRAFYESLGLTEISQLGAGTLRCFVRIES